MVGAAWTEARRLDLDDQVQGTQSTYSAEKNAPTGSGGQGGKIPVQRQRLAIANWEAAMEGAMAGARARVSESNC